MCFICGAPCIGVRMECGFAFEFCDGCLVENDELLLHRVMEAKHALQCGCSDVTYVREARPNVSGAFLVN